MEQLWILSSSGKFTGIEIPSGLKVLHLNDYSTKIYQQFNIEPIYQRFYYKGEHVWDIANPCISQKKPVSLLSIESSPHKILYIALPDPESQNLIQYPIAIEYPESKTLYNAFNLMRKMYKILNIFNTCNFIIYDQNEYLSINTPLSSLKSNQIYTTNTDIPNYLKFNLTIENQDIESQDIEYYAQANLIVSELISFIALKRGAMGLKPLKSCLSLSNRSTIIDKDRTLKDIIQDDNTIITSADDAGGAMTSTTFINFESPSVATVSGKAPNWRLVKKGLSFIFICPNEGGCKTNKDIVIASVGYGIFDLARTVDFIRCPECSIKIKTPPNYCGYYNAKVSYVGYSQGVAEADTLVPSVDKFLFYNDTFTMKWSSLTIICRKNKESRRIR
ncbi:hypothetical protein SteCoe_17680 [Stentor coeruleus]|uniref:Uncharacterized protein n=1 Tax=Stentor coeruleus TaxID=5963 RepID=A0A1R2BYB0_9CILI|nr:hypothetical protein SteCoe_17680 [Stentor coeruleus]